MLQGLVVNGYRPEPDATASAHPKFELIREKLSASVPSYLTVASDLRKFSPVRHNQLQSSSCVAQSTIRAAENKRIKKAYDSLILAGVDSTSALQQAVAKHVGLSRLALYYLAREIMSPQETDKDEGTFVSVAADALKSFGVCKEDSTTPGDRHCWPFDLTQVFVAPPWLAMREAFLHKIAGWYRLETVGPERVNDVILALAAGNPVVYGTTIDTQWSDYDGSKPLGLLNGRVLGGHATVLLGWDPVRQVFLGENSWGDGWGVKNSEGAGGFYEMLPDVIASPNSSDFVVYEEGWDDWSAT